MKTTLFHILFSTTLIIAGHAGGEDEDTLPTSPALGSAVRPADELFWVPTLDQAISMATANRVPIFAMGYSLVGDRSTYTKFDESCASAVF
jgi:hypothetical protein